MAVETVSEAAKRAGLRLRWIETGTSSEEALRRGLVDLWPLMVDLPDRRKFLHLTEPWFYTSHVVLLRSGALSPDKGFSGRIAVFKMPIHLRLMREAFPKAVAVAVAESRQVVRDVCKGTVPAGFLESRAALNDLSEKPPECAAVTLRLENLPDLVRPLGIGSTFEAAGAADQLRHEIGRMFRDGTLAAILAKYSYGLEDTWATFHLMAAAEQARWIAWGVFLMSIVVAVIVWQAASLRQRRRAEAGLRESEERFRNVADTAPVMIWIAGTDKVLTFFNKTWLDFVGRTLEQEVNNGWAQSVHPDDLDHCFSSYCASFDAREPFQIEYRLRRADGEYRCVLCSGVPRFASAGVFAGYIGSDIDITDVKRAEQELALNQALRESEEKYHGIVETMTEGVWILDHDDRTTFVNRQMAAMLGYSVEQMVGRHVLDFKDEEARPLALQRLERRRQGITEQYDSTFQTSDGRRLTVLISTRPLWDGDGRYAGTLGIITDITERSLLEERLHQANKMEAIGRLAGGVAHDFNNLLTVINGYSDLLLRNLDARDRTYPQISEIRSAGQRAQELTNQILAFSRNQMRATDTLNLGSVIEDVEEMLRRMIGEDIELRTIFDPGLGNVRADRTEVIQVLLNLAVNARDAMPSGGTLTFALANVEVDETDARTHPGAHPGPHVLLTVTDTGFGMDAEIQRHLFEPFFTTKQAGKGTGLGLATVYGIVSQSGGWIQVDSKLRQGTTFRIYWPRVSGAIPREKDHARLPGQPLFGTETVLVVEDQPQVREMTCSILRQFGYQILEASSGEEALCLVEAYAGPLHLLLTDVIMPGMNGQELAGRLRTIRPTPVLFMSGYSDSTEIANDSGAAYIQKPFTPDTLARAVREALGGADHAITRVNTAHGFQSF